MPLGDTKGILGIGLFHTAPEQPMHSTECLLYVNNACIFKHIQRYIFTLFIFINLHFATSLSEVIKPHILTCIALRHNKHAKHWV